MGSEQILSTWTIFDSPLDAPDMFVVRRFDVVPNSLEPVPTDEVFLCASLRAARSFIPPGLFCMGRDVNDHPTVVETWL